MKVTEKDVRYVEDLANLELTEGERGRMVTDLNSILGYIDQLNELDTSNVEPMAQVQSIGSEYAMRPDEPLPSLPHEDALKNAPESDGIFFKVPKVIDK
ncbi:MAG TPA: Asp-tRNA(Asn)/Glu-tRNA(Gln) amidotransferase subunit GatC [Terriglobales bacterium]|nr:Asp-tRNA(Asn)/Glu-tRNA(Gln) amidotransferase subunit GatC [Terriglobales bacterium]